VLHARAVRMMQRKRSEILTACVGKVEATVFT